MKLRSLAQLDLARELREAIANGDIGLRYVGRHDLATGRLVAWVGYLRWMHPIRGEVRPAEFLRVAESTGLAAALSRAVLSCLQRDFTALAPQWDADVRISFGALRHHILHDDFAADIAQFLAEGAVPASTGWNCGLRRKRSSRAIRRLCTVLRQTRRAAGGG